MVPGQRHWCSERTETYKQRVGRLNACFTCFLCQERREQDIFGRVLRWTLAIVPASDVDGADVGVLQLVRYNHHELVSPHRTVRVCRGQPALRGHVQQVTRPPSLVLDAVPSVKPLTTTTTTGFDQREEEVWIGGNCVMARVAYHEYVGSGLLI